MLGGFSWVLFLGAGEVIVRGDAMRFDILVKIIFKRIFFFMVCMICIVDIRIFLY